MFATCFLKINLQQPRPFWLSDEITAIECESGYGYPSNHVLTTVPTFLIFFEIMYYRFELDKTVNKKFYYWLGALTIGFLCILIGLSRLVMGVHSLDQIIFGLVMGFAFYFFFLDIIDFDLKNPAPFFKILYQDYGFYKMVFIYSWVYIIFFLNSVAIGDNYESVWTDRMLVNCGHIPYLTPFFKCFTDVCDFFMLTGITIGLVYESKMGGTNNLDEYVNEYIAHKDHKRIGNWNDTDFITSFLRSVIAFIECYFLVSIFGFISSFFDHGLVSHMLFVKVIPLTAIGFIMFGLFKKQFEYMNLTNKSVNEI
jgi:hypothetical protein